MSQLTSNSQIPLSILRKLRLVRQRKILVHIACAVIAALAVLLAAMGVAMLIDWLATLYDSRWRVVLTVGALLAALLTTFGWFAVAWRRALGLDRVAGDIDRQMPQLQERWTTMTRLGADATEPKVVHPAMLRRVATEAESWEPHVEPMQIVSLSTLMRTMLILTAITAVLAVAVVLDTRQTIVLVRRFWSPGSSISATQLVDVPGDMVVGRGEPVALAATVEGTLVENATLFLQSGQHPNRAIKLVAHGDERVEFSHRLRAVEEPFEYRFRAGDGQTDWHSVSVAERPEIEKLHVTVTPPGYTRRPKQTFDHLPRRISAMQNSNFELALRSNVPVQRAELQFGDDKRVSLVAHEDGWFRWNTTLEEALSLAPILTESHGLTNRPAPTCDISIYQDKPPTVKVLAPDDEMAVQPDDTIQITFTASDDVGIGSAELLVYESKPGGEPVPIATILVPLEDATGALSIQETVDLDLSMFAATDGVELSYEVRVREDRGQSADQANGQSSKQPSNSQSAEASPSKSPSKPSTESVADNQAADGAKTNWERTSPSPKSDRTAMPNSTTTPNNSTAANTAAAPNNAAQQESAPAPNSTVASNDAAANDRASAPENATTPKDSTANASSKPSTTTSPEERPMPLASKPADKSSQPNHKGAVSPPLPNPPFANPPGAVATQEQKARDDATAMANNQSEKTENQNDTNSQASATPRTATSPRQGLNSSGKSNEEQQAAMQPDTERPEDMAANSGNENSANEDSESGNSSNAKTDIANSAQANSPSANTSKSQQSQANGGEQKAGSQQKSAASQMAAKDKQPSSPSDSPPGDSMTRRTLDVAAPQSSSSQRMRLKVDKWAGSFSGQQRAKLEMAIAPELEALDLVLAKAQSTARGVLDQLAANAEWRASHDREVTNAEKLTVDAQNVINKLEQRSKGTPYAFVGLQLVEIGLAHVEPARNDLWKTVESDGDDRANSVSNAVQHLTRARELLTDLRGQFARTRREFQLAESVEQVKKMYQVFVENSLALLQTQDSDPDRYNRKMAQFELDDEYLKRLKEVIEMRNELRAELARILGDDPRLLRRFIDSLRNRSNNLREELADLVARQNELNREVRAWAMVEQSQRPTIARVLLLRHVQRTAAMATAAGKLQERYETWLPLAREAKDADLSVATKRIQEVATAAGELNAEALRYIAAAQQAVAAANTPEAATGAEAAEVTKPQAAGANVDVGDGLDPILADAQKLYDELTQLDVALRQIAAREDDVESAAFAANRLLDTRRLIADSSAWLRQLKAHQAGNYTGAAEVDQYRLAMKTEELAGNLGAIEQSLADMLQRQDGSLPAPIAEKAREFLATLDREASPNQLAAVYALHGNVFPRATDRQQSASAALEKAEKQYDELMKLAIAELDKLPVQDPIADLLDDPTLDELLAQLEQELQLQELLGIPTRPSNLRVIGDWVRPGNGSGGGGGGGSPMAGGGGAMMRNQVRQDEQRARNQLNQAYRRAIARALKETEKSAKVEVPKPAKLSDWNRLVSQLGDDLRQGRDKAPPEQYRRAIEQYFSQISSAVAENEEKPE